MHTAQHATCVNTTFYFRCMAMAFRLGAWHELPMMFTMYSKKRGIVSRCGAGWWALVLASQQEVTGAMTHLSSCKWGGCRGGHVLSPIVAPEESIAQLLCGEDNQNGRQVMKLQEPAITVEHSTAGLYSILAEPVHAAAECQCTHESRASGPTGFIHCSSTT
jgi:hypothetical protein